MRLDLRPDDLRATVESAVEQAEAAARRRGVSLTTELPDGPLVVRHDPPRIGQVVSNLVGNALKFTPRGGSVRVKLAPHRQGGARIQVIDTGVGIDAAELPHIFDRFYRGSRRNEARGSGSGLGLAIVRSIVEMHGGRIGVESRVGSGSTFTVTLPADPRSPAERAAAAAAEKAAGGRAGRGKGKGAAKAAGGSRSEWPVPEARRWPHRAGATAIHASRGRRQPPRMSDRRAVDGRFGGGFFTVPRLERESRQAMLTGVARATCGVCLGRGSSPIRGILSPVTHVTRIRSPR